MRSSAPNTASRVGPSMIFRMEMKDMIDTPPAPRSGDRRIDGLGVDLRKAWQKLY